MSGLVELSAEARSKTIGQNFRCRAWVSFNGTGTVAIRKSANVSSITDHSTGNFSVGFSKTMPDSNYVVAGSDMGSNQSNFWSYIASYGSSSIAANAVRFVVVHHSGAENDQDYIHVAVFR